MYKHLINDFKLLLDKENITLSDLVKMYNATATIPYNYKTINAALNSGSLRVIVLLNLLGILNYKLKITDSDNKIYNPINLHYLN